MSNEQVVRHFIFVYKIAKTKYVDGYDLRNYVERILRITFPSLLKKKTFMEIIYRHLRREIFECGKLLAQLSFAYRWSHNRI